MSVSGQRGACATRAYVEVPYEERGGHMQPVLPGVGPCQGRGSRPCQVSIHHWRERKTSIPWGAVAVARCRSHGASFTLYPPGHAPYIREPVASVGPDGHALTARDEGGASTYFDTSTYFDAAWDAARGERWPRADAPDPPGAVVSTQRRRIVWVALLLGLVAGASPDVETAAGVTDLGAGRLQDAATALSSSRSLAHWGRTVIEILDRLGATRRDWMDRLRLLGRAAGLWGRCFRLHRATRRLVEVGAAFPLAHAAGTAEAASPRIRGSRFHESDPHVPP